MKFFVGDIVLDACLDTAKLIPFLFLTYLFMEWLEHKTGSRTEAMIRRAGKMGPMFGGLLGVIPQCGFSAAAANLHSGGLITAGSLVAVFLSTSDEMLPIFISMETPVGIIVKILAIKLVYGMVCGFLLDVLYHGILGRKMRYKNIHMMCESEHCKCEEGILKSAIRHTLQITFFIFLVTLCLGLAMEWAGQGQLAKVFSDLPVIGELIAGLVGLLPTCASSVVVTQLYVQNVIGAGPMLSGLFVNAGVGILVLCRINKKHVRQNAGIIGYLYIMGVLGGFLGSCLL